jgi:histidyl-tRNA synthetase
MYRQCKNPKGTIDYVGKTNKNLEWLINTLSDLFRVYDAEFIRTPIFELKNVLLQKYGEEAENKLLYHLEDQSHNLEKDEGETESEKLTLRYDHTIPLVRYLVQHKIQKGKFARIGEVFRRDAPSKKQIRLRSFYQADFDFVGESSSMEYEIYIFSIIEAFFSNLNSLFSYGPRIEYEILFNFRNNLFKMFESTGIDKSKYNTIASSIDKLDKQSWDDVSIEMCNKGLTMEQVNTLKTLIEEKYLDPSLQTEYDLLLKFNDIANPKQKLRFEPSLARGLDYYTGIIFEVTVKGVIGSVAAGGRYDGLIESYKENNSGITIPLIGVSFGLNRFLPLLEPPEDTCQPDYKEIDKIKIYIACIGDNLLDKKIELYTYLKKCDEECKSFVEYNIDGHGEMITMKFSEKFYVETSFAKKKLAREINKCVEEKFNMMIILGETEDKNDEYQIKLIKSSVTYFIKKNKLMNLLYLHQGDNVRSQNVDNVSMLYSKGYLRYPNKT